ncbi:peptidylprolyl isomerase [Acaryochloris sp. IP29b_bin.137]|uniref:peptidylprolyl isomerase n=1 Tax=Acaryochloris sp. IP29b_bin.137 TaxID=2969217 RepID=UPI002629B302|nr:peptidylprolyl isomerase [Acaryochloris sp. IP29b_bin.137]
MYSLQSWLKKTALLLLTCAFSLSLSGPAWSAPFLPFSVLPTANAVKDGSSILRFALPINEPYIREIQNAMEGTTPQIRGKRWPEIRKGLGKAKRTIEKHRSDILAAVTTDQQAVASEQLDFIAQGLLELEDAVAAKDIDQFNAIRRPLADRVGIIEEAMITEFPFDVPEAYQDLPQLKGRATIAIQTNKGEMTVVVDGYTAPVTAGNFVDLVQRKFYDGLEFTRAEESYVVQTGDPDGPDAGFIDPNTGEYRAIPLEIMVKGDSEPIYGITLEDAGIYLDEPVLTFSSYGTMAMARPGDDPNGGSSQFFFLLFEPELTPAGSNLLDGRYAVFGYVIEGQDVLGTVKPGDRIESARVIQGAENLV